MLEKKWHLFSLENKGGKKGENKQRKALANLNDESKLNQ